MGEQDGVDPQRDSDVESWRPGSENKTRSTDLSPFCILHLTYLSPVTPTRAYYR